MKTPHSNVLKENEMLRQQLIEAQALVEDRQKQEPVGYTDKYGSAYAIKWTGKLPPNINLYAAPVIAPDVLKDAQRYQWLREYLPSTDTSVDDDLVAALNPQEIDAAIDKAMGVAND